MYIENKPLPDKYKKVKKTALIGTVILVVLTVIVVVFQIQLQKMKKPVIEEPVAEEPVKQVEVDKDIQHLKEATATFSASLKVLDSTDPVTVYPAVETEVNFDKK